MNKITLSASNALHKRPTNDGTWFLFPCPFCRDRGHGPDRGHHLGVKSTGAYKCFRCEASSRTVSTRISLVGVSREDRVNQARQSHRFTNREIAQQTDVDLRSCDLPEGARHIASILDSAFSGFIKERVVTAWPSLPWGRLCQRGLAVSGVDTDRVIQPYVTLGGVAGHVVRRFRGDPKALTFGPPGPATFPDEYPLDPTREIVVVEGWADGVAVPFEYQPVFMLGSPIQSAGETLSACPAPITLAFDGDRAGKSELKSVGLSLLRRGRAFSVLPLGEGVDPGDLGPTDLAREMKERISVEKVKDFLDVLSSLDYEV